MAVRGYFGADARERRRRQAQPSGQARPKLSQAYLRERRQAGYFPDYGDCDSFVLSNELRAVASPFAAEIASLPYPDKAKSLVDDYADGIHEAITPVPGWSADVDAVAKTEHLADQPSERAAAQRLIRDLSPKPVLPEITPESLVSASWPDLLAGMAEPLDEPLRSLLERGSVPRGGAFLSQDKYGDRLRDRVLRDIDRAGIELRNRLKFHRQYQAQLVREAARAEAAAATPKTADDIRNELRELGIEV